MTPEQLERIKAYIGKCRYDEKSREIISGHYSIEVIDPTIGQFVTESINEKLERMKPEQDEENRQKKPVLKIISTVIFNTMKLGSGRSVGFNLLPIFSVVWCRDKSVIVAIGWLNICVEILIGKE